MSSRELCALLGIETRSLRNWIKAGLLPRPPHAGKATLYSDAFVLRARAIAALRQTTRQTSAIRKRLAKVTDAELRQIAGIAEPAPAKVAESPPAPGIGWRRVEILDGLELHLRSDASPAVQRVFAEIVAGRWPTP